MYSMEVYKIRKPENKKVPILISSPHSGTFFPEEVARQLKPERVANPDDTDWFIDGLYDFAPEMGITMIAANYSRWVVDLNRDPNSKPLYSDGRVITGLVPTTNFNGEGLYLDKEPDQAEVQRRLERYYLPYHQKIGVLLQELKEEFGKVVLFDAHSIRKFVPGIRPEPFPDLILGDNDETSASKEIISTAIHTLQEGTYDVQHNHPFKGGYITRSFGKPSENVHALQLEMAKTNYMDDSEVKYDTERAEKIRTLLKNVFQNLIATL